MSTQTHGEKIEPEKAPNAVSWYRPHLETSLALIEKAAAGISASVIDGGGGESTLVDDLLVRGYENITVLDTSQTAVDANKKRLGNGSERVHWLVADITKGTWHPPPRMCGTTEWYFTPYLSERPSRLRAPSHARDEARRRCDRQHFRARGANQVQRSGGGSVRSGGATPRIRRGFRLPDNGKKSTAHRSVRSSGFFIIFAGSSELRAQASWNLHPTYLRLTLEYSPECIFATMRHSSNGLKGAIQTGEGAQLTALTVDTIRFYERRALLPPAPRTTGKFRLLHCRRRDPTQLIKKLLHLRDRGRYACEVVRDLLKDKLIEVRSKIMNLQKLESNLAAHLRKCTREVKYRQSHAPRQCPVLTVSDGRK